MNGLEQFYFLGGPADGIVTILPSDTTQYTVAFPEDDLVDTPNAEPEDLVGMVRIGYAHYLREGDSMFFFFDSCKN